MADEATATTAAPAAPAASQSTPAGDLDAAIARAVALGGDEPESTETAEAPSAPAGKKPARRVEALEAKAVAATAEASPEPADGIREKARYHLQHGDVAKAIDVALGDLSKLGEGMPDAVREALARKLGVGSKNWEQVRRFEARAKRELASKEQQIAQLVDSVKSEFAPFAEAKKLYESGDFEAAFKTAFGEELADFQRKAISQRVGRDPEVERLKAEIARDREERQRERQQLEQLQREQYEAAQIQQYQGQLQAELSGSEDPAIARYAARPEFVAQVFEVLRTNYNPHTKATVPVRVAAEYVRDQILDSIQQWAVEQAAPKAAPAAAAPAKPAPRLTRTLKQTGAAEATGTPRKLSSEEIRLKHQRIIESLPAESA